MRISRIHIPLNSKEISNQLTIEGDQAHYLRNVLRLKSGRLLVFFTLDGVEYSGTISEVARHHVRVDDIEITENFIPPSAIKFTLIQGISASDRMDYTVQKAAELGASQLIPVFTEFGSHKIPENKREKRQQHWQAVANSACEQSGRCELLHISPIQNLSDVVKQLSGQSIYLEPTADKKLHDLSINAHQSVNILIGPEGGFSDNELALFESHQLTGIQLGNRILRTETAAPVIMAAMHALFGDFK